MTLLDFIYRMALAIMAVFMPVVLVLAIAAAWQTWQHLPELFR